MPKVNIQTSVPNATIHLTVPNHSYDWDHKVIHSGEFVTILLGATIHYKITADGYYDLEGDVTVSEDLTLFFNLDRKLDTYYSYKIKSLPADSLITVKYNSTPEDPSKEQEVFGVGEISIPKIKRNTVVNYVIHSDQVNRYPYYILRSTSLKLGSYVYYKDSHEYTENKDEAKKFDTSEAAELYIPLANSEWDTPPDWKSLEETFTEPKYSDSIGSFTVTDARTDVVELQAYGSVLVSFTVFPAEIAARKQITYTQNPDLPIAPSISENGNTIRIKYIPGAITALGFTTLAENYETQTKDFTTIPTANSLYEFYLHYDMKGASEIVLVEKAVAGSYTVTIPKSYPSFYIKNLKLVGGGGGGICYWHHSHRRGHTDKSTGFYGAGASGAYISGNSKPGEDISGNYLLTVGTGGSLVRGAEGSAASGGATILSRNTSIICSAGGGTGGSTITTVAGGKPEVFDNINFVLTQIQGTVGNNTRYDHKKSEHGRYEKMGLGTTVSPYPPYGNGGKSGDAGVQGEKGVDGYVYLSIALPE